MTLNDTQDILGKLDDLMEGGEMKAPTLNDIVPNSANDISDIDEDSDNNNYDDGEVINLNNKIIAEDSTDDFLEEGELDPDLIGEGETESVLSAEENEIISDSNEEVPSWQLAIKDELKEFSQEEEIEEVVPLKEEDQSIIKPDNLDLDEDFGVVDDQDDYVSAAVSEAEEEGNDVSEEIEDLPIEQIAASSKVIQQAGELSGKIDQIKNKLEANMEKNQEDSIPDILDDLPEEEVTSIISDNVSSETKALVGKLKRKVDNSKNPTESSSMENFLEEMMRPMLKEWLDKNLPGLVRRVVQKEIKKLVD